MDPAIRSTEFPTAFGSVTIFWGEEAPGPVVKRIVLPGHRRSAAEPAPPAFRGIPGEGGIAGLIAGIRAFLSGEDIRFGTGILDLAACPPFQRRVLLAEYAIPRGSVSTYGRIARHLGVPGGARAVGNALAKNPFPIVIPCHRALRSDGDPGGFQGGREMKIRLLAMEGIRFTPGGKAIMDRVWY